MNLRNKLIGLTIGLAGIVSTACERNTETKCYDINDYGKNCQVCFDVNNGEDALVKVNGIYQPIAKYATAFYEQRDECRKKSN
ncbi:MAG: hypothetical protein Q8Q01_01925 [archaeon]|nr:hypothetical protein [archaeon]